LEQVKTHIQGDLKLHLQGAIDDEKETLLKVKKAFSEVKD
jgi:hypothetical protein